MAGFFPVFFKEFWSYGTDVNTSTALLGLANSLASIDRTYNTKWSTHRYGSRDERRMKQALAVDPATTLNFYICNIGGGLLGYATFPDMYAEDSYMHGVVCLYASAPGGAAAWHKTQLEPNPPRPHARARSTSSRNRTCRPSWSSPASLSVPRSTPSTGPGAGGRWCCSG